MNKTKLGLSANLYAAIVFLAGLFGITPLFLADGAVLMIEENEWLKRMAVKAVIFVISMSVINIVIYWIPNAIGIINDIVTLFDEPFSTGKFNTFIDLLTDIVDILESIGLVFFAYQAYHGKYASVPMANKIVEKNM